MLPVMFLALTSTSMAAEKKEIKCAVYGPQFTVIMHTEEGVEYCVSRNETVLDYNWNTFARCVTFQKKGSNSLVWAGCNGGRTKDHIIQLESDESNVGFISLEQLNSFFYLLTIQYILLVCRCNLYRNIYRYNLIISIARIIL